LGRISIVFLVSALIYTLTATQTSFAGLGDHAESISTDQRMLSAKRSNADVYRKYSIQEMESDSSTVKEYVDSSGVIFAITWQGLDHPDLDVVLGSYYEGYQADAKAQPRVHGKRFQSVKHENLVVQKWGRMRNFRGRAYDPSLIPSGVSLNEIK
jgi:hypothetical protein